MNICDFALLRLPVVMGLAENHFAICVFHDPPTIFFPRLFLTFLFFFNFGPDSC